MLDFNNLQNRIELIDREDRALLRSNQSAWLMPEDGQEHMLDHVLLSSRSSFGRKAINPSGLSSVALGAARRAVRKIFPGISK